MKTILVHAYTQVNLGDDLFLRILKNRYPNTIFTLISKNGHPQYNQFEEFKRPIINIWERIVRKIISFVSSKSADNYVEWVTDKKISKKYDAYLILGGSMFMQHDSSVGYVEKYYNYHVDTINHSFVIGANFGPFNRQDFLEYYTQIFSKCDSIVFRDTYSANFFPSLNNITSKPDIVFQYKPELVEKTPNSVGISVIDLTSREALKQHDGNYIAFLSKLIEELIEKGKSVYIYSFCKREGDEITIDRISKTVRHNNLHFIRYDGDIDGFLRYFGSMEVMFASRFHAMILGLIYKQKMIPLVYSKKMTQVLDDIEFTGKVIEIDKIDQECVTDCIDSLHSYKYNLPNNIREESAKMFKEFDEFILSHS